MKKEKTVRKSVCFLTHEIITGGIETVLIEAVKALHPKYDVEVVSLFKGAEKAVVDAFPADVTVRVGPFCNNKLYNRLKTRLYFSRFYFNKSLQRRYDYIISLKYLERWACFSNKGQYHIYWCHNDSHRTFQAQNLNKTEKKEKRLTEKLYKKHDMIWTVNDNIAAEVSEIFPTNNIYALPNPLDCNAILEKSLAPCDIIFDKTKINIVLLGRISSEKGFGRVVRIMRQNLFAQFPNVHIYIIGGGPSQEPFHKRITELDLSDKITLLGSQANPFPYLKQADLLILPSKYESFGLVIMEAMLLNVPVIATATTGAKYVTQNGKYACCVENDDDALQNAIYQFLKDPKSYNYPKADAQKWVWQHDTSEFGKKLIELLEKCETK